MCGEQVAAECSLEDSIATCTCDKFYEGNGTECQVSGPPGMTMAWLPSTFDGLEREWYEADGAFLVEGIKFPIGVEVNNTDKDGQLFHTGGQTDSIWVGIYNGMFHVQAGASGTATLKSLANTAVFRTSDFPQDDIEHYILILAEVGESGRSTGKVTVWIDCYLKGSAETTGLALGTQGRFSGPDSGAYLVGGKVMDSRDDTICAVNETDLVADASRGQRDVLPTDGRDLLGRGGLFASSPGSSPLSADAIATCCPVSIGKGAPLRVLRIPGCCSHRADGHLSLLALRHARG